MTEVTDAHRGGDGEPLVLLHGFLGSWRVWRPVLDALEADHRVFAPTLPGHRGATPGANAAPATVEELADEVETWLDREGIETAHLVGNSLGGWLAVVLARRGRARSVVALSPAGAWARPRDLKRLLWLFKVTLRFMARFGARLRKPMRRPRFRRLAMRRVAEHGDRIPLDEAHGLLDDMFGCTMARDFLASARDSPSIVRAAAEADVHVRIAWAEHDKTIPFRRFGRPFVDAVPGAELVIMPGVGHVPMYDDPRLVVRTILEVTGREQPPAAPESGSAVAP